MAALNKCPTLDELVGYMELLRNDTQFFRARGFISCTFDHNRHHTMPMQSFAIHKKIWFPRERRGWRQGNVSNIYHTNTMIVF